MTDKTLTKVDTVTIIIDDVKYEVPAGTNLVDMAKWHAGNDIPVFCYHPKMEPVGMCRMCLVELGMIQKDRETGEVMLDDDGNPKIRWFPKLQTACTQTVSDGMVVRTNTQEVEDARTNVLEFLLTSHPLDCPICDKGGECPLQNLTMEHGPETSRMHFADKMQLDKHVPLGDLIYLDEERCIQCGRCVRFQDEIVGDPVLAFHERGRRLQIITNTEPGFDTYFSGNTTDICPVGALTTADFRFGARPWELTEVPSICPHDAAGSNISLSMRLDRDFGGRAMIKRVMPRQNEHVNEIWISDKTRFGHHFTRSDDRLVEPMLRKADKMVTASWDEAMSKFAELVQAADGDIAAIAGSQMSNEDLWALRQLVEGAGGEHLGAWPHTHGGHELVAQVGVGKGTNFGALGAGDAVLIMACDLEEEVPIWRLRLKQAADRGAYIAVGNVRHTRMDDFAAATFRYAPGQAAQAMQTLKDDQPEIAETLANAENLIILAGAEGLTLDRSEALMQSAANFLIDTEHVGKPNNGLLSPFPGPNGMGQYYFGYSPRTTDHITLNPPKLLIVAQAELLADDPAAAEWLKDVETVVSLSLFPDPVVTDHADLALPIQSFAERDGTYTNGERRVQRFYTAQGPMGVALPVWQIFSRLGEMLGQGREKMSAAAVMLDITRNVDVFDGMRYREISRVERQFPDVGGDDKYYGGTAYQNKGGVGVQIPTSADNGDTPATGEVRSLDAPAANAGQMLIVPVTLLYNRESTFMPSTIVHPRVMMPYVEINEADAAKMGIEHGDVVQVATGEAQLRVKAYVNGGAPEGAAVLPRHLTETPAPMFLTSGEISKV